MAMCSSSVSVPHSARGRRGSPSPTGDPSPPAPPCRPHPERVRSFAPRPGSVDRVNVTTGRWATWRWSMSELDLGPIDYLALEFPTKNLNGEGMAALVDLVDRGIIRILDARFAVKETDGSFTAV